MKSIKTTLECLMYWIVFAYIIIYIMSIPQMIVDNRLLALITTVIMLLIVIIAPTCMSLKKAEKYLLINKLEKTFSKTN